MRYRLRTLLIVLALGPPMLAVIWFWGLPAVRVAAVLGTLMLMGLPYVLVSIAIALAVGWTFSLIASWLIRINTGPDDQQ